MLVTRKKTGRRICDASNVQRLKGRPILGHWLEALLKLLGGIHKNRANIKNQSLVVLLVKDFKTGDIKVL